LNDLRARDAPLRYNAARVDTRRTGSHRRRRRKLWDHGCAALRGGSLFPGDIDQDAATRLGREDLGTLTTEFRGHARWRAPGKQWVTEKLPSILPNPDFIMDALPEVRVLHMRRDPMDTCFSILRTDFSDATPHSYDQPELVGYHLRYRALVRRWAAHRPHDERVDDPVARHAAHSISAASSSSSSRGRCLCDEVSACIDRKACHRANRDPQGPRSRLAASRAPSAAADESLAACLPMTGAARAAGAASTAATGGVDAARVALGVRSGAPPDQPIENQQLNAIVIRSSLP
jgi:hypothetical protein